MSSFVHDNPQLSACELSQPEWRLLRNTEQFLQRLKEQNKRCEGDDVMLGQLQDSMDFLVDHFEKQLQKHRSNRPFVECITTGWYNVDKYYNKIDESGAHAAAILLHPNKQRAYLQAAWQSTCIKPGLRRDEELWTKKFEKLGGTREYTDSANVHYVHHVMSCALMRHDMNIERLHMNMFICATIVRVMLVPEGLEL